MHPQSSVSYVGWFQSFFQAKHFGSVLALSLSLVLAACGGGGNTVTENDLVDPGADGVAPTLTSVSILQQQEKNSSPDGVAKLGQSIKVDFTASEALMLPVVTINGVEASLQGKIGDWSASREMVESDVEGYVTFNISFSDTSGEVGVDVSETTDDSRVQYCVEGCVAPVEDPLVGEWMLDGVGAAGVGPTAGSMEWFTTDADVVAARACWFDDSFVFGLDGSFSNEMGADTWVEAWQGGTDSCGAPVAPHDGTAAGTWVWDEAAGTLTINGKGAHLGLPKAVNGQELATPSAAPDSITYNILTLTADGMNLTVTVETAPGVWWTFNLAKKPVSPFVGTWKLDGAGAAGVGPTAGSMEWFTTDADVVAARACWFDDSFVFGADGSFSNEMGTETWVEAWQGGADSCGAPVAPHDGSAAATFSHNVEAGTVTINGLGAHLGLPKAVNGQELASPSAAPESITYNILTLTADGMNLTVTVETAPGVWWTFNLAKVPPSVLIGTWMLDGAGAAGVGPTAGSMEWFTTDADVVAARACWFDDSFVFGADGSFSNEMGTETWVEAWQGGADSCGAPVAPHDGTAAATFSHDVEAGTLTINGLGAHLGLPKAVNGQELATPSAAPESITYSILTLTADGMNLTVTVETAPGVWWTFNLAKNSSVVADPVVADPVVEDLGTGDNNVLNVSEVINFNSATVGVYALADFGNNVSTLVADPTDATNTVVSVVKGNETWAGTTIASGLVIYPLTATETVMSVRVWSPEAGITVRLKLEESGDPTHSVETDAVTTKAQEWETLTFDFSNQGEGTAELNTDYVFDTLSIFLNFGSAGSSETYYFDDVTFIGAAAVASGTELVVNRDFQAGSTSWLNADTAITSYYAVDVASAGDVWSVNLSQVMTLTPATSYDVSFKAKGSVARDMVAGLGLNAAPYSAATETVSLTTEWTTFTYTITTTTADGVDFGDANSRVLFDMGGAVGQVWIDDVSVKLTGGDGAELLTNGDFQAGPASWLNADTAITSYFAVDVTSAGEVYSVNLSQVMTLTPATSYEVSFKAKGSVARDMVAGLGLNAAPYSAATETVSLTTEWQTFTYTITTTTADGVDFGDANSRVLFDMGGAVGQVWIDDVSVK